MLVNGTEIGQVLSGNSALVGCDRLAIFSLNLRRPRYRSCTFKRILHEWGRPMEKELEPKLSLPKSPPRMACNYVCTRNNRSAASDDGGLNLFLYVVREY